LCHRDHHCIAFVNCDHIG